LLRTDSRVPILPRSCNRRDPHVLDVFFRDSELVGDRGGEVGDARRMPRM